MGLASPDSAAILAIDSSYMDEPRRRVRAASNSLSRTKLFVVDAIEIPKAYGRDKRLSVRELSNHRVTMLDLARIIYSR